MKKTITILALFLANHLYSQKFSQLFIPLVKENYKIDSLMDIVISQSNNKEIYFSINTVNLGYAYGFYIYQLESKGKYISFPLRRTDYMKTVVYFSYRGHVIFIGDNNYPSFLFDKTNDKKKFDFIWDNNMFYLNTKKLYEGNFEYSKESFFIFMDPLFNGKSKRIKTDSL